MASWRLEGLPLETWAGALLFWVWLGELYMFLLASSFKFNGDYELSFLPVFW